MRYKLLVTAVLILILGCKEGHLSENSLYRELKNIPQARWDSLMAQKIYFGHQSVGFNIIDGIADTMAEMANIKLNIKETKNPHDFNGQVLAHSAIGRNKDPLSKIADFKKTMDSGIGERVNTAFFKFCYVDIVRDTDIRLVFKSYCDALEYLRSKYPGVNFIHMTVPLRTAPRGPGAAIKRLFRMPLEDDEDNIKRNLFNIMLLNEFGRDNRIFDLAGYESAYDNGRKAFFIKDNAKYPVLAPEYTKDGGHLNETCRKIIAGQFLIFLASLDIK